MHPGVGADTDSRHLLDSRVHSSLVVAYYRVRHTRVGRTLEYANWNSSKSEFIWCSSSCKIERLDRSPFVIGADAVEPK